MKLDVTVKLRMLENRSDSVAMDAIGVAAITIIREETQKKHIAQNGRRFKKYSKDYAEFRKKKGRGTAVDLNFTGDMLKYLMVKESAAVSVVIGFLDATPASGGLKPSQKMRHTNDVRPWFGFGRAGSKRRINVQRVGREIFLRALTGRGGGSN